MVIIVDSGSTKADWCIVEDGFVLSNVTTQGISPVHQSSDVIVEIVRKQLFVDTDILSDSESVFVRKTY